MKARYWHAGDDGVVRCDLCPHRCRIPDGRAGHCRVRRAGDGVLEATAYGLVSSAGDDPIEKKPLYHFHPGRSIFSVGSWGCNFACRFCQNWTISQQLCEGERHDPGAIVQAAAARAARGSSVGIAYTYNEPLVGFEFVYDCASAARGAGLKNVLVTNGFINPEPAAELLPLVDALNIDIKSIDPAFYREYCAGRLEPVLAFAEQAHAAGCHLEVTNLVIPGLNDGPGAFDALSGWVAEHLGRTTPLHLSAYRPEYRMQIAATPPRILLEALGACGTHLDYVYLGNVALADGADTCCPGCGAVLVERRGYRTAVVGLTDAGACADCGREADLVL